MYQYATGMGVSPLTHIDPEGTDVGVFDHGDWFDEVGSRVVQPVVEGAEGTVNVATSGVRAFADDPAGCTWDGVKFLLSPLSISGHDPESCANGGCDGYAALLLEAGTFTALPRIAGLGGKEDLIKLCWSASKGDVGGELLPDHAFGNFKRGDLHQNVKAVLNEIDQQVGTSFSQPGMVRRISYGTKKRPTTYVWAEEKAFGERVAAMHAGVPDQDLKICVIPDLTRIQRTDLKAFSQGLDSAAHEVAHDFGAKEGLAHYAGELRGKLRIF